MKKCEWILSILLLVSVLSVSVDFRPALASGTIYIRADGSVEGTTDIQTADNVTYAFIADISDSIVVERDDIVVDGNGHTLQGGGVGGGEAGIDFSGRTNVTVKNTVINAFSYGFRLSHSSNSTISANNITDSSWGILISSSSGNSICGNNVTDNHVGIELDNCSGSSLFGNQVTGDNLYGGYGIGFSLSSNNSILGNSVRNSEVGVLLAVSSYNNISGNNVTANLSYGIELYESSGNAIHHNDFIDNPVQAEVTLNYYNTWDNGYPSGGNYWSDYTGVDSYRGPYQNETGSDEIGDTPYVIDANYNDSYPLMRPGIVDITVNNVTPAKTTIGRGYHGNFTVAVQNQGDYAETFDVRLSVSSGQALGDSTILSDDFDDNALDASKWVILSGGGTSSVSETNQRIEVSTDGNNRVYLKTLQPVYTTPSTVEVDTLFAASHSSWSEITLRWDGQINEPLDEPANGIRVQLLQDYNSVRISRSVDGTSTPLNEASYTLLTDVWYRLKVTDDGETIRVYIDDTPILQASDAYSGGDYMGLSAMEVNNLVYFDNFLMKTPIEAEKQTITLESGASTTLVFTWNTAGSDYGNYTIGAYAEPVPGEANTVNNNLMGCKVYVGVPGDVDADGTVNILDAIIMGNHFLEQLGTPGWSQGGNNADINSDNVVNILDAIILSNHFLEHYP